MSTDGRLLLAESGASKTHWVLLDAGAEVARTTTRGFNPNVQRQADIAQQLTDEAPQWSPNAVVFYGAALSRPAYQDMLARLLGQRYGLQAVAAHHDLLGAARSVGQRGPCTVGILGTGSSACAYDGTQVVRQLGGLGYLFGDEGSGAHLGKQLVAQALNGLLPEGQVKALEGWLSVDVRGFLAQVYQETKPNVRLAELTHFLAARRGAYRELLVSSFRQFLQLSVRPLWPSEAPAPLSFVGSVAAIFEDELREACQLEGLAAPQAVVQHPIEGLIRFHQSCGFC